MSNARKNLTDSNLAADEIDLVALMKSLWKQRVLIVAIMLAITVCATLYAVLVTPQYQVKSLLRVAQLKDLDKLNSLGLMQLDGDTALDIVGQELGSYQLRQEFYAQHPEWFAQLQTGSKSSEQAFDEFNEKAFKVLWPPTPTKGAAPQSQFVGLEMTYPKGVNGVEVLNGLVNFALQRGQQRVKDSIDVMIKNRIDVLQRELRSETEAYLATIESEIAQLRETNSLARQALEDELAALRLELKIQRDHRLAALNEAITIAQKLKIEEPTTLLGFSEAASSGRGTTRVISTGSSGHEEPLYLLGIKALLAERDTLLARKSDDFQSPRIAEIYKELELLKNNRQIEMLESRENQQIFLTKQADIRAQIAGFESLRFELDDIRLVRLDQPAVQPVAPIKPKRTLIVLLAIVAGFILGVMVALVRSVLVTTRQG